MSYAFLPMTALRDLLLATASQSLIPPNFDGKSDDSKARNYTYYHVEWDHRTRSEGLDRALCTWRR